MPLRDLKVDIVILLLKKGLSAECGKNNVYLPTVTLLNTSSTFGSLSFK